MKTTPSSQTGKHRARKTSPRSSRAAGKRPGAPLGNKNALKHGFYARHFTPADLQALDQVAVFDLQAYEDLITVFTDRFLQSREGQPPASPEQAREDIRTICLAAEQKARLVRQQSNLDRYQSGFHNLKSLLDSLLSDPSSPPADPGEPRQ